MSQILTSLRGKLLGLDENGYLTSPVGIKVPTLYVGASGSEVNLMAVTTPSSASNIGISGLTNLSATAASTYTLDEPVAGIVKRLFCTIATSQAVKTAAATFVSTLGSTFRRITFASSGDGVTLVGLSTSQWAVMALTGATSHTTTT